MKANYGRKSYKTGADELKAMIKEAVNEELNKQGEEAGGEGIPPDVVAEAIENLTEKRKARKAEGEELGEITTEEIMDEVAAILDGDGSEAKAEEDPEEEAKGDEDAEEEKRCKSASRPMYRKQQAAAPVQRKYSNIFLVNGSQPSEGTQLKKISPVVQIARAVKCIDVHGHHDLEKAAFAAKSFYQDDAMAREFKAMATTNPAGGGFLIPERYMSEVVELLYPNTVVFELGAQRIPMPGGNINIPKMTAGVRARWGAEARKISTTKPKYGNLKLSSKRLAAIIPQTRELIMSAEYSADQLFGNDLVTQMQLGLDYGALFGKGTDMEPLGIFYNDGIEHFSLEENPISPDNVVGIRAKVMFKNVASNALGWTFNSLVEGALMNLKTTTGAYIYRDEMLTGKLMGAPYKVSNQVEVKKKGNKYLTSMIFGNWSELLMGEQLGLETFTSFEGSYTDDYGTVHSAVEENLAITRALTYADVGVRHDESFLVIDNIDVSAMLSTVTA